MKLTLVDLEYYLITTIKIISKEVSFNIEDPKFEIINR